MSKLCCLLAALGVLVALAQAEPPRPRLRFPSAANNRPLPFLARQEAAEPPAPAEPAPYPPAGLKPEPAFELPQPTYLPPDQTYGPPDQTYGPPDQAYGPPDQAYGPPEPEPEAVPAVTYGPPPAPAATYGPPGTPAEEYGPPPAAPTDNGALPQTASIIDPRDLYPQSVFALPRVERLTAFRPRRRPAPAKLRRPNNNARIAQQRRARPQPHPAKLVLTINH